MIIMLIFLYLIFQYLLLLALMMALRLNEPKLITEILESIPTKDSKCLNF